MAARSESFWEYPIIQGVAGVRRLSDVVFEPQPGKRYKLLFDVTRAGERPDAMVRGLRAVAHTMNSFGLYDSKLENLAIAAVIHGPATDAALKTEIYRQKHGMENPNAELIRKLKGAGAELYVCGQALEQRGYPWESVMPEFKMAYCAITAVAALSSQGYTVTQA
jgi:intracellular sulfur oxidation DsrE/DsrF family protein